MASRTLRPFASSIYSSLRAGPVSRSTSSRLTSASPTPAFPLFLRSNSSASTPPPTFTPSTPPSTPPPAGSEPASTPNIFQRAALSLRSALPGTTETYVAFNSSKLLYLECARQAEYGDGVMGGKKVEPGRLGSTSALPSITPDEEAAGFWYVSCRRNQTFNAWAQVTILHMWMITVRLRALEKEKTKIWMHHFVDHFFYDAEERMMRGFKITNGTARSRYLKELFVQYRGMIASLDEGFVRSDAVLASAIWRNVFDASESVDYETLATIVSYVRRCLAGLDRASDEVIERGLVSFGKPQQEVGTVRAGLDKFVVI